MSKEPNEEVKRCFFCHKRLVKNKGFICKRCQLRYKDKAKNVATVATVATTAIGAFGSASAIYKKIEKNKKQQ